MMVVMSLIAAMMCLLSVGIRRGALVGNHVSVSAICDYLVSGFQML
jgi:hypothetical protein